MVWTRESYNEMSVHGEVRSLAICQARIARRKRLTICFATMMTVFKLNLRPQWSNRSSNDGPRRSMTRML